MTKAQPLSFKPLAYGRNLRASYCADYLEVLALLGKAPRWGDFGDFVGDLDLAPNLQSSQESDWDGEAEDSKEDESDVIQRVKDQISERSTLLGIKYPFEITSDGLKRKAEKSKSQDIYLGFLALTMLHTAEKSNCNPRPEKELENSVAESLSNLGMMCAVMGTTSDVQGKFSARLGNVGTILNLIVNDSAVVRAKHAQDEGVDVVGLIELHDRRSSQWSFIGQVTCANSDEWLRKAKEPRAEAWKKYLGLSLKPQVFLAVPHHAEQLVFRHLGDDVVVLDRIRLANSRKSPTAGERKLLTVLRRCGIESVS